MAKSSYPETGRYLYEEIRDQIRARIERSRYQVGERLPGTRAFVEEFSTTPVTINRALSDLVDSGYIRRVAKSGSFVNPREEWSVGVRKKTGLVGIIAFDTNVSIYWTKVVEAMQDALEARGFHAVIGYSDHRFDKAASYVDDLAEKGIDGLIYVPIDEVSREAYQRRNEEVCRRIEAHGIPFLLFDRRLTNQGFSSVTADFYKAARELTNRLAHAGSKRPLFLTLDYAQALWEREQAFLDNGPRYGMECDASRLVRFRGTRLRQEDTDQLASLLDSAPNFDGLFIANSSLYAAFLRVEERRGGRWDVPIVTFRDIETPYPDRPVARALQPVYDFGFAAGDLLARTLEHDVPGAGFGAAIHVVLPIEVAGEG